MHCNLAIVESKFTGSYCIRDALICGVMGNVVDSGSIESVTLPFILTVFATSMTCCAVASPEKETALSGR